MIEKLIKDFPEQFKAGENTKAITDALDAQIDELKAVFEELRTLRHFDTAVGRQLDLLGGNVGLTRAQAMNIMDEEQTLDDDLYRKLLKHKAYKNSNNGTYYDLMEELKIVLGDEKIYYREDSTAPATIFLTSPSMELGQIPPSVPAGIGVVYETEIMTEIDYSPSIEAYSYDAPRCGTFRCGTRRT